MPSIVVTSSVFQSPMTRLIVAAPTNVYSIVVAAAMLQSPVLEHVMHGAESARSASRRSPPRLRRVAVQFLSVVRSNVFRTSFVPIPSEVAFEGANVGADVICEVGVDVGADVVSGFSVAAPPNVFLSTLTSRGTSKSAVPVSVRMYKPPIEHGRKTKNLTALRHGSGKCRKARAKPQ
jgi:hypothetical protein